MAVLLLEEIGLAADAVASGGEAVAAVTRGRYDAVLLDARMPDGSGADALREIRRVAPPPLGPRLVAMTASASRSDHEELRAAGAEACLLKPLTAGVLREALGAVAAPATLDARVAQRLAAGRTQSGPAAFAQLVDLYLDDTPAQLTRLREAATLGDAGGLGLIAHRLRGSSASIGATHMMTLASEVESRAGRGDMAAACSATQALEGAWIATRVALEQARRAPR
jgi:CheY-like chemotaxis protein